MLSHAHRARSSAHLPPTRQGARVAGTAQAAARAEAEGMRADSAMADSAGGQRGRRGHVVEGSPLTRRLDKRGMPPHPLGKGYAVWGVGGPFAVPASSPSDDCTGAGECGLAAWTAPRTRPSRLPRTTHARAQHTQHHAPAGHGLTPTGHQEALLHVAWQRPTTGERERGHGQRAPGRTRGQAPGATGCAAWRPGPPGLPAGLTVHPIVLLVAPLAQDGGGAIVDDGGRPGGRQAAEHARHALHGVGLGRARVGLCREQQAGLAWVRAARWTQAREAEDDSCPPPRDRCPPGVPPACTSGRLGSRGQPGGGGQAPWLVSPRLTG